MARAWTDNRVRSMFGFRSGRPHDGRVGRGIADRCRIRVCAVDDHDVGVIVAEGMQGTSRRRAGYAAVGLPFRWRRTGCLAALSFR
jgi:hypothetical protein